MVQLSKSSCLSVADAIRKMSDENLATYFCGIVDCEVCPAIQTCDKTPDGYLKYLQSPLKEEISK